MHRAQTSFTRRFPCSTLQVRGGRWLRAEGGVRPRRGRDLKGRCLTFGEREEIALGRAGGESMRAIARRVGRSPSTNVELRRKVEEDLRRRYSPEQIVGRLRRQFPDDLRDAGVARDDLPIAVRPVARGVAA
jgi:IS30 family transposase